jgi:5-methylcytosine-specific restriction enzyme A
MPTKPPTFCPPGRTFGNEAKRKAEFDKTRPSAKERGYDSQWRALAKRHLERNPICTEVACKQRATEVDHIYSIRDRPDLRLAAFNLRSFCKSHHSARTARDQSFRRGDTGRNRPLAKSKPATEHGVGFGPAANPAQQRMDYPRARSSLS